MKFIVIISLIIGLIIGLFVSFFLFTYLKEIIALPIVNPGSEDEEKQLKDDKTIRCLFYVSIFINILTLSSCIITFNL